MDTQTQSAVDRVYEDYEPYYEWARDEGSFTFTVPGFRWDQLKVQVTSKPALKLNGERQITGNRWRRFDIEFPIPSDYDLENVSAELKFQGTKLHVKFAKLVEPKEATNPPEETSRPKEPSQNVDQQNAAQEVTPKAKEHKAEARTNNEVSDQNIPQKEKEKEKAPSDENEKSKTEAEDSDGGHNKRKKLVTCGLLTLLGVGLGIYAKDAFTSSHEGSKFQDL